VPNQGDRSIGDAHGLGQVLHKWSIPLTMWHILTTAAVITECFTTATINMYLVIIPVQEYLLSNSVCKIAVHKQTVIYFKSNCVRNYEHQWTSCTMSEDYMLATIGSWYRLPWRFEVGFRRDLRLVFTVIWVSFRKDLRLFFNSGSWLQQVDNFHKDSMLVSTRIWRRWANRATLGLHFGSHMNRKWIATTFTYF
jgi:hypothetical protein